jgi:hypothetical protein
MEVFLWVLGAPVIVGAAALTIAIAIGTIKGVIGAFSKK